MAAGNILVVKLSSLGDIFHALPAVHALRVGLDADVDWVTQPEYTGLVRCFKDVREVIPFPRQGLARGFAAFWRCVRRRHYDLVVDLQGLMKSLLAAKSARGQQVLGPSYCREGTRFFYDAVSGPANRNRHAVDEAMDVVRFLGLSDAQVMFPVAFPTIPPVAGAPRVAMLPASRHENKNWPLEYFAEVARGLVHNRGASIHLFGSEADRTICLALQHAIEAGDSCSKVVNMAGHTGMVQLGGWLASMDLVIANDSGPIHMAAAAGTRVLAIFGPTDPRRTGPYGDGHCVLTSNSPCSPCCRRICRREDEVCLRTVSPELVFSAASEMLNRMKNP